MIGCGVGRWSERAEVGSALHSMHCVMSAVARLTARCFDDTAASWRRIAAKAISREPLARTAKTAMNCRTPRAKYTPPEKGFVARKLSGCTRQVGTSMYTDVHIRVCGSTQAALFHKRLV